MRLLQNFMDFLSAIRPGSNPPLPLPPLAAPLRPSAPAPSRPDNGHIRRKRFAIRQLGADGTVNESENRWHENNGVMEGEDITTRVISASGEIVEPSELKIRCHVCGKMDNHIIRSAKSHLPLCRRCQRIFKLPDGRIVIVTPQELIQLKRSFNTWKRYDAKRRGLTR